MNKFNDLTSRHWRSHGFIVFPQSNSEYQAKLVKARTLVNTTLNETFPNAIYPKTKEEALSWVNSKSKIQSYPDVLNLIDSNVTNILETILESKMSIVKSSQIAVRFPGENNDDY